MIGPGTGLGVGGLLPVGERWQPIPGEGGHVSLAPQDEVERRDAARRCARRFGHVSNERVLSGPGLVNLACRARRRSRASSSSIAEPMQVAERARSGECRFCSAALARFSAHARRGGGRSRADARRARRHLHRRRPVPSGWASCSTASAFRAAFVAKGRLGYFLEPIPTYLVVTGGIPGLLGAAALALMP